MKVGKARCEEFLSRKSKPNAVASIDFLSRVDVQIRKRNLYLISLIQNPKQTANNCVILDRHLTAVTEHKRSGRRRRLRRCRWRRRRWLQPSCCELILLGAEIFNLL